jgi:hypothetical protein
MYDQHLEPGFFAAPTAHIAKKIAEAVSGVSNGRVLEVACGTGIVTEALRGPDDGDWPPDHVPGLWLGHFDGG